jgi:hypothetical protein
MVLRDDADFSHRFPRRALGARAYQVDERRDAGFRTSAVRAATLKIRSPMMNCKANIDR